MKPPVSLSASAPKIDWSAIKNPVLLGWYADPELRYHHGLFWIYPTDSKPFEEQTHFDVFSSPDLVHWTKHERVLALADVKWCNGTAAWAPSVVERYGARFMFFSAGEGDGIGLAVWHPFRRQFVDALRAPLVGDWPFGAQPIDANVFVDPDTDEAWLYWGGHGRCVARQLRPDMNGFAGECHLVTPAENYVEGPFMFKRRGRYYFSWSEGDWTDDSYAVAYAIADHPLGPFRRVGVILKGDGVTGIAAGHASFLQIPGTEDEWAVCYHRRAVGETCGNHRVSCIDRVFFREDGSLAPIRMT